MKQKFYFVVMVAFFAFIINIQAFGADVISIQGIVYDRATDTQLFVAKARLLNSPDSTLIAETVADGYWDGAIWGEFERRSIFTFNDVDRSKKYILELTRDDYQTLCVDIDPSTLSKRLEVLKLGKLYMKRQARTLDEVVVRASKVMFYNKGDTVIYNADAFVLAEGSMLDDLIRQMPGVELKEGGQIYVNGRYVENLLLNGKDFFKGNRQMMLDNLGAYTVKDIAVYDRQDEMDAIMGKDYGTKHLSMDVRLKKEYNQGLLTNMEAGYGSSRRYLGRIFGLWYSDNARISLYGNANNLSDNRKPGQDTDFTPGSMKSGDFKTYQGGFDYWAKIPYKDASFSGEVIASHLTVDDDRSVLTTNFLPGGDTYGYSFSRSRNKSLSVNTSHSFDIQKTNWNFKVSPSFKYSKSNDFSGLSAATFSEEMNDIGKDFIDNLYDGASSDVLAAILNRNMDDNKILGHNIDAGIFSNGKIKLHNDVDAVTFLASGNYSRHHLDRFQRYTLNFGGNPEPADYSDRYFDNTPNYRWSASGAVGYIWAILPGMYLDSWYQFDHAYSHEVSDLFRLENMLDSASYGRPLGWLPSKTEYERAKDFSNSYNSSFTENKHSLNFKWTWIVKRKLYFGFNLPLLYRSQHLNYLRGDVSASFSRNKVLVGDASFEINYYGRPHYVYFDYSRKVTSPNLVDMVDFRDDLDPLNVRLGNKGLKDSETHRFRLRYRKDAKIYQTYGLIFDLFRNSLAYGYDYDSATGVKIGRMYNVNGNYAVGVSQYLSVPFGSVVQFEFENTTDAAYRCSVDLISENSDVPERNKVTNPSLTESLGLSFKFGRNRISLNGEASVSRFNSSQYNFRSFTANDFKYGVRGNFSLPAGFGLSTDFNVYTRRGYSDSSLNKTNFVWNVRASYTILKGQLTFMADGFDILHNLSNVFYSVNAQARTETYTNVLPRYVMFHIQWKFHKAPKKK